MARKYGENKLESVRLVWNVLAGPKMLYCAVVTMEIYTLTTRPVVRMCFRWPDPVKCYCILTLSPTIIRFVDQSFCGGRGKQTFYIFFRFRLLSRQKIIKLFEFWIFPVKLADLLATIVQMRVVRMMRNNNNNNYEHYEMFATSK